MLNAILNTNEVRNAAGTAIVMQTIDTEGRNHIYQNTGSDPRTPTTLSVKHLETGNGARRKRQSAVIVDIDTVAADGVTIVRTTASVKLTAPVGAVANLTAAADALAMAGSFVNTTGTSTLLYNGTGTGASALIAGAV